MIKFAEEGYEEFVEDLKPLLESHANEVENFVDEAPVVPLYEAYKVLNELGQVIFYTAREEETEALVGYSVFWIQGNLHRDDIDCAANDLLYVKPEYRGQNVANDLILFAEHDLAQLGIKMVSYSMKTSHRFDSLMERNGYEHTECVFQKVIK